MTELLNALVVIVTAPMFWVAGVIATALVTLSLRSHLQPWVCQLWRKWNVFLTRGLPDELREDRLREFETDLHELKDELRAEGLSHDMIGIRLLESFLRGVRQDLAWRYIDVKDVVAQEARPSPGWRERLKYLARSKEAALFSMRLSVSIALALTAVNWTLEAMFPGVLPVTNRATTNLLAVTSPLFEVFAPVAIVTVWATGELMAWRSKRRSTR